MDQPHCPTAEAMVLKVLKPEKKSAHINQQSVPYTLTEKLFKNSLTGWFYTARRNTGSGKTNGYSFFSEDCGFAVAGSVVR